MQSGYSEVEVVVYQPVYNIIAAQVVPISRPGECIAAVGVRAVFEH